MLRGIVLDMNSTKIDSTDGSSKNGPNITTYLSDMIALERHIQQPLKSQIGDSEVQKSSVALREINAALEIVTSHITALEARLDALGGHAGLPIKSGVATALGAAATAIGNVRKTEVSKDLRDDYSALCLASAGYTMLLTTALGLGDAATAALAKKHLADDATVIMRLSSALPVVVLAELTQEGVVVDTSVVGSAEEKLEAAWREGGQRAGTHSN
jgi:ferritin-like metal-binding protein YciE